jgi:hypothetical protein
MLYGRHGEIAVEPHGAIQGKQEAGASLEVPLLGKAWFPLISRNVYE